jgi:hypothetical protein
LVKKPLDFEAPDPKEEHILPFEALNSGTCLLLGLAGAEIRPETIYKIDVELEPIIPDLQSMSLAKCSDRTATESRVEKIALLRRSYPKSIPESWEKSAKEYTRTCERAISQTCENVYPVANTYALAYPTKGCKVRRVTANDVRDDVEQARRAGRWTEAEGLEHLELGKVIDACSRAGRGGWTWRFKEPKLAPACGTRKVAPSKPKSAETGI